MDALSFQVSKLATHVMPPFSSFLNSPNQTSTTSLASSMLSSTSRRLSNESFSFSWLADVDKPSFEIVPYVVSRHRSSTSRDAYEFDFGLSRPLPPALVHADQIFSNGFLLPLHLVDRSKSESTSTASSDQSSDSTSLSRSLSLDSSSESYISFSNRYRPQHPRRCDATGRLASLEGSHPLFPTGGTKSTKLPFLKICARKYLCLSFLLAPWSKKARRLRLLRPKTVGSGDNEDDDFSSAQPRCRGGARRISDNSYESAIDEAILHCKKSVLST